MKTKIAVLLIAAIALTGLFVACPLEEVPEVDVTVTFDANEGTSSVSSVTLKRGKTLGDQYPVPEREGFVFMGWFEGVTEYTEDMVINVDLALTASWLSEVSDSAELVTITFNFNEDSPRLELVKVKKGGVLGPRFPPPPRKKGNYFVNWTTPAGTEFIRTTVVNNDITVTANWDDNVPTYTVTFAFRASPAMPGTPPSPIVDVYEGDCIDEWEIRFPNPPEVPLHSNPQLVYSFTGWADDESVFYTGRRPITKNVTVYATLRRAIYPPLVEDLDLTEYYQQTTGWNAFTQPYAISSTAGGRLTAIFNAPNQAIVIPTPTSIRNLVQYGQEFTYTIDGEASPEGKAYRAFIGRIGAADNWNATASTGEVSFEELSKTVGPTGYVTVPENAQYFILMARNQNAGWPEHAADNRTTVIIRRITIRIE